MAQSEDLTPEEDIERQLRQEYGELYDQLTRILFAHDPMGLARLGAPDDEYSVEVDVFLPLLHEVESPKALSQLIYEIFVRMSHESIISHRQAFDVVGEDIWHAYQQWYDICRKSHTSK